MRTVRAYLELLRLPNVFTAVADVAMGYIVTHPQQITLNGNFARVLIASICLYLAGMVLNDVFDAEVDARERPQRPIPSGRIPLRTARAVGWSLLVIGTAFGWYVTATTDDLRAGLVATALAVCILLYNGVLKSTIAGPLTMGACRALNVLLGMSVAATPWQQGNWVIAAAIGVYIAGVTWLARQEAGTSSRGPLTCATGVMLAGMLLLSQFHRFVDPMTAASALTNVALPPNWYWFWAIIAALIGRRCVWAIARPTPENVQAAVKLAILSLILFDASVCYAVAGRETALAVLALLLPAMFLGRWIYST